MITLGLSSQQFLNFKFKLLKERWKDGGSRVEGSPTPQPGTPPEEESSDNGALAGNHQRRGSDSSGGHNSPWSPVAPGEHKAGLSATTEEMTGDGTLPRDGSEGGHEESGGGGPLGESTTDGSSSTEAESSNPGDGQTGDAAPSPVKE